jgi:hypothetical protein
MRRLFAVGLLTWAAACGAGPRNAAPVYERDRLTRAELATRPADNMQAVLRAMRPNWLLTPAGASGIASAASNPVRLWVDGNEFGGAEMLSSLPSSSVESARYLTTTQAQSKYGLRVASPVIEITSRKPGAP